MIFFTDFGETPHPLAITTYGYEDISCLENYVEGLLSINSNEAKEKRLNSERSANLSANVSCDYNAFTIFFIVENSSLFKKHGQVCSE